MLTLKWVMRDPERRRGRWRAGRSSPTRSCATPPAMVLDNHGPCRVADGDNIVGVVDDEDILRVVVAEEDAT